MSELKAKYSFDARNGLNYIMIGEHWSEIDDENRIIYQIEKCLDLNLSNFDYWNLDVYDNELEVDKVMVSLRKLRIQVEKNPQFYKSISYGFELIERYFENGLFLNDILYMMELIQLKIENGATKIKYETE